MKRLLCLSALLLLLPATLLRAQTEAEIDSWSDAKIDSIQVEKQYLINNYSMIGVQYGYGLLNTWFNPPRETTWRHAPLSFGVSWTRYYKMFGLYPYFGLQIALLYGHQGFSFKKNPETGVTPTQDGMTGALLRVVELPVLMQGHLDAGPLKFLVDAGSYVGYRLSIERFGEGGDPAFAQAFKPSDYRFDYGLKGGVGIGYQLDRVELHLKGTFKWSLQSYYEPNYYSQYYYRFSNPFDVHISVGVHLLLEKRRGRTRAMLREEARRMVQEAQNTQP